MAFVTVRGAIAARRPGAMVASIVVAALLVVATMACAPPGRVHTGPAPVRVRSWEMGRDLPVARGIAEPQLAGFVAGWDTESAALEEPGTVVLFAHRVSHGGPFRTIDALRPGQVVAVEGGNGRTYVYRVVGTSVTAPSWAAVLDWRPANGRGLSLVACHPPGSVSYRIVVHAELSYVV
jgi:sortase A